MPTRAEVLDPIAKKPSEKKKKKRREATKARLEVAGLVAAMALVLGLIGYLLWPVSARYLYGKAEVLMASKEPSDWRRARDEYLEPLNLNYPNHPYREKTEAWLDKIDLDNAQGRARILEKINLAAFSKPQNEAEALYQNIFEEVEAARKLHHDRDAEALWRSMVTQLPHEGRENRGWLILARSKADEMAKEIEGLRKKVTDLLNKAMIPNQLADNETARRYSRDILASIVERFDPYPDVADLVGQAKAALAAEGATTPQPEAGTSATSGKTEPTSTAPVANPKP